MNEIQMESLLQISIKSNPNPILFSENSNGKTHEHTRLDTVIITTGENFQYSQMHAYETNRNISYELTPNSQR